MKKIKYSLILLVSIFSRAQTTNVDNFKMNYAYRNITTPEKANLMKFDEFPNIGAIGGADVAIPIYTLNLDGLEIPISLVYNTKGVKVADIASNIGLGWSFIGDGSIESQVNDLNDFEYAPGVRDGGFDNPAGENFNFMAGYLLPSRLSGGASRSDLLPDFYYINAPSLKNKFYLKKDLSVCPSGDCMSLNDNQFIPVFFQKDNVKNYQPIKPVSSNNQTNFGDVWNTYFKDFYFVNNIGFKYKFSDPLNIYTANFNASSLTDWPSSTNISYSNWKLDQIISPYSSKAIVYTYENFVNSYTHPTLLRNNGYDFGTNLMLGSLVGPSGGLTYYNTRSTTQYTNTKRLKKIGSQDAEIVFNYDDSRTDYAGGRLNSIQIKDIISGKIIKTFTFYHSYFIPNETCNDNFDCYRLRLDRINDSSSGNYIFNYGEGNSDYKFPRRSSSKIDFAGYYNENSSNIQMYSDYEATHTAIPQTYGHYPWGKVYYYAELTADNYIPFSLNNQVPTSTNGTIDLSSNNKSLIGLLTNVIYPTGGSMKISYENDQFNYLGSDYLLGSARIKKLELLDGAGVQKVVNYEYKLDNGSSSGQIAGFIPPTNNGMHALLTGLELINNNTVIYSKVTEKVENKGKTEFFYSNYDEYPNVQGSLSFFCHNSSASFCNSTEKQLRDLKYPYLNIYKPDQRRSNLKRKRIFNNTGNILSDSEFLYEHTEYESLQLSVGFISRFPSADPVNVPGTLEFTGTRSNKIYTYANNIKKEISKEYLNGVIFQSEKSYTYDLNRNLLRKIDQNNPSYITSKNINYAEDKNDNLLINANIKAIPLEVEIIKNENNIAKSVSHSEVRYKAINTDKIQQSQEIQYTLGDNLPQIAKSYDSYDLKGNLQQYTTKDGVSTTIIWGYNGTQPIAKIEGAKLQDVPQNLINSIVNTSNTDAQTGSEATEAALVSALDSFRTQSTLSGYQITTYSYDPLIGVKSITPPSGIREIYLYDTANRLKQVREHSPSGRIIKEYQYHYKN